MAPEVLRRLEEEVVSLWTGEICLFTMVDEVIERARGVFGLEVVNVEGEDVFDEVVKFAEGEEMKRFLDGTYYCEICLERKKGSECLKLPRCGHVSCRVRPPPPSPSPFINDYGDSGIYELRLMVEMFGGLLWDVYY